MDVLDLSWPSGATCVFFYKIRRSVWVHLESQCVFFYKITTASQRPAAAILAQRSFTFKPLTGEPPIRSPASGFRKTFLAHLGFLGFPSLSFVPWRRSGGFFRWRFHYISSAAPWRTSIFARETSIASAGDGGHELSLRECMRLLLLGSKGQFNPYSSRENAQPGSL